MGRRPAALLASLAALAAAFVAGWLAGRAPSGGSRPAPLDSATAPTGADAERASAASPTARSPVELRAAPRPPHTPTPVVPPADAPRAGSVVLDRLEPARIRVAVRTAEGAAVAGADVFAALPGTTDVEHAGVARAESGPDGGATVAVARPGPYLVVVRQGILATAVEDVHAAPHPGGEVVVTLPRAVVVEVATDGAPDDAPWTAEVEFAPLTDRAGSNLLEFKRLERRSEGAPLRIEAAEGSGLHVRVHPFWQAERWKGLRALGPAGELLTAPGACRIRYGPGPSPTTVPGRRIAVELTVVGGDGPLPAAGRLTFAFRPEIDGRPAGHWDERIAEWDATRALPPLTGSVPDWPVAGTGALAWRIGRVTGRFVVPGTDSDEGVLLRSTVPIPLSDVESGPSDVEVTGPDGAAVPVGGDDVESADLFAPGAELGFSSDAGENLRRWLIGRANARVVAVRGAWWVSPPTQASIGEPLRLRLELGGYVLLHLPTPPSTALGSLRVERVDGAWLGRYAPDEPLPPATEEREASISEVRSVSNGTMLGPLPPGTVELRFLLGGIEVGRATARVVAGQVSVLTIR